MVRRGHLLLHFVRSLSRSIWPNSCPSSPSSNNAWIRARTAAISPACAVWMLGCMPVMLTPGACDRVGTGDRQNSAGSLEMGATREDQDDARSDVRVGGEGPSPSSSG